MASEGYEVGKAYVAILPSFRGFQQKVEKEIRKTPDATVDINADVDTTKGERELDRVSRDKKVTVDADADTAKAEQHLDKTARTPRRAKTTAHPDTPGADRDPARTDCKVRTPNG